MDIELFKILIDGGFSAVIIFMLFDMRNEQRETNKQIWALLDYLVRRVDDQDIALG